MAHFLHLVNPQTGPCMSYLQLKTTKQLCKQTKKAKDGQTLENIPHHVAVSMLKRTSTRVVTEVVSWMGTEL